MGLRAWVAEQTGVPVGYVEQLYTFGDRGRQSRADSRDPHEVSVGYLALTRICGEEIATAPGAGFREWYRFFPWEDLAPGRPSLIDASIMPGLRDFMARGKDAEGSAHRRGLSRIDRVRLLFGEDGGRFDEENVLDRYELLYEAGLVEESARDGRQPAPGARGAPAARRDHAGRPQAHSGHRHGAVARQDEISACHLRADAGDLHSDGLANHGGGHFRPPSAQAEFPPAGRGLLGGRGHRRNVARHRGRPAALFRFRREVLQERPAPGLRVGIRG